MDYKMKDITFNLHYANTLGAFAIRLITRSGKLHHGSVTLEGKTYESKVSPLKGFHSHWARPTDCISTTIKVPIKVYDEYKKYLDFYSRKKSLDLYFLEIEVPTTKYDYKSLLGFLSNSNKQKQKAFNCIEPLNYFFELAAKFNNEDYKEWQTTNISPKDFMNRLKFYELGRKISNEQ